VEGGAVRGDLASPQVDRTARRQGMIERQAKASEPAANEGSVNGAQEGAKAAGEGAGDATHATDASDARTGANDAVVAERLSRARRADVPRFGGRLGLAIAHPRWALTVAVDRKHAGRSGSDLIAAIVLLLAATQLRGLATAVWLGSSV